MQVLIIVACLFGVFCLICGRKYCPGTVKVVIIMWALQAAGWALMQKLEHWLTPTPADQVLLLLFQLRPWPIYMTHSRAWDHDGSAPLIRPTLVPILLGRSLSQAFNWRTSFYFLLICGAVTFLSSLIVISHTFALLIWSSGCQIRSDPIHRSVPNPSQ